MAINIPNILTWARIAMIPLVMGTFCLPDNWLSIHHQNQIAAILFILAAITDWFDGFLARALKQTSAFGAFLDPVADKLMVATALIMLVQLERLDAIIAVIIIGREITISALREWMAKLGKSTSVAVATIGKFKTTAQMVAITLLLYHDRLYNWNTALIGTILIYIAALLTLWSMGYYFYKALPQLRETENLDKTE